MAFNIFVMFSSFPEEEKEQDVLWNTEFFNTIDVPFAMIPIRRDRVADIDEDWNPRPEILKVANENETV